MLTKTLVTAAASGQQAMPAGAMRVRPGAPTLRLDGTSVSTVGGCAPAFGFTSAAVIGNDTPGSPPWSPPV